MTDADIDTPRDSSDAPADAISAALQEASTSDPAAAVANGHSRHPLRRESPAQPAGQHHAANGDLGAADASCRTAASQNGAAPHGPRMNGLHQRRESAGDSRGLESRGTSGDFAESGAEDAVASAEARRLQELRCRWDDLLAQAKAHPASGVDPELATECSLRKFYQYPGQSLTLTSQQKRMPCVRAASYRPSL